MNIKIGSRSFAVSRPADLDEQILAATGCSPAEIAAQLRGEPLADIVARAVLPFLPEPDRPPVAELAAGIAAAGTAAIAARVAALYRAKGSPAAEDGKAGK